MNQILLKVSQDIMKTSLNNQRHTFNCRAMTPYAVLICLRSLQLIYALIYPTILYER